MYKDTKIRILLNKNEKSSFARNKSGVAWNESGFAGKVGTV
jgi:hypothetical protein